MEKRYQVFVSSTFKDLVDERREVMQALLELDCIPAGMELFPAADQSQWELIQRVIDDCDYYVVVVGGRYGSLTAEGISYTEKEFDCAVAQEIPVLGFLPSNPDAIPKGKLDDDPTLAPKLAGFVAKVEGRPIKRYDSPEKLGSVVSRSLIRLIKDQPGEGWVKGRNAMTPETAAEMSELRARVAELSLRQEQGPATLGEDLESFQQGEDLFKIMFQYRATSPKKEGKLRAGEFSWNTIIRVLGPELWNESTEASMAERVHEMVRVDAEQRKETEDFLGARLIMDRAAFATIKMQLLTLGLIERGTRRRAVNDVNTYWKLTKTGELYVASLLAQRRPAKSAE
jgi:Domain of unknown function (DUF4062)